MIFGNFAENYEFAAMKSSGISLQRAMRTLAIFMFFVGIGAFLFANTVMPSSERRFINLRKNIFQVKPAMVITPNQFNDLGDINIKVGEKYGDNGQYLKDIIIHKKSPRAGNYTVIKAVDGELKGSIDSDLVTLILNDGNYYDEIQQKSPKRRKKLPFAKAHFKQYVLNMDLSALDNVDMDAQNSKKGYNMLNISDLQSQIDTFSSKLNSEIRNLRDDVNKRSGFNELNRNLKIDSVPVKVNDSLDFIETFNTKQKLQIYSLAFSNTDGILRKIETNIKRERDTRRALNKYEMSLHDKYALGIACVLLFFVGAPLGAIIRKGGLGLPIVVGVLLFLTYHFIGIFAKNGAEEGGVPPYVGSWLSTFIIFPLSIFLTYRATTDQGFFSLDNFVQPIRDFFEKKKAKKTIDKTIEEEIKIREFTEAEVVGIKKLYSDFNENSILAIVIFSFLIVINIVISIISAESNDSQIMLMIFNIISVVSFLIFFFISFRIWLRFQKITKEDKKSNGIVFLLFGLPLYFVSYFFYKKSMKEDIAKIR